MRSIAINELNELSRAKGIKSEALRLFRTGVARRPALQDD
jgi:hypothetical protein